MGETWEDFALKGKKISRKLEWENCGKKLSGRITKCDLKTWDNLENSSSESNGNRQEQGFLTDENGDVQFDVMW